MSLATDDDNSPKFDFILFIILLVAIFLSIHVIFNPFSVNWADGLTLWH